MVSGFFTRGLRQFNEGNDSPFNKCCWNYYISPCKIIKLVPDLKSYARTNSKRIINLNIKTKAVKLLKEIIRVNVSDIGLDNSFYETQSANNINKKI